MRPLGCPVTLCRPHTSPLSPAVNKQAPPSFRLAGLCRTSRRMALRRRSESRGPNAASTPPPETWTMARVVTLGPSYSLCRPTVLSRRFVLFPRRVGDPAYNGRAVALPRHTAMKNALQDGIRCSCGPLLCPFGLLLCSLCARRTRIVRQG